MSRQKFVETVSALDGRSDPSIASYYVETSALKRIRGSDVPSIGIVGLKGSGKTTLFRLLTEQWAWEPKMIRVGLAPDKSEFEAYAERLSCLQFANSVKQGMPLLLLQLIDENVRLLPPADRPGVDEWLKRKAAIFKPGSVATNLLSRMRGLSILGCGLEIGDPTPKGRNFKIKRLAEEDNKAAWDLLRDFGQYGIRIRVVIDDPDRLFTYQGRSDANLLAGYILGTNDISTSLKYVQFVHILKGNILEDLGDIEEIENLPSDYFEYISWTNQELKEIIESRLKFSEVTTSEVFSEPLDEIVDILSSRIRNGPRDFLRYIELTLKRDAGAKVSLASLDEIHPKFKQAARRQVRTVYDAIYGGLEPFLNAVFLRTDEMTLVKFRDRFRSLRLDSEPPGVDYSLEWLKSAERAFRALIETGTVDLKVDSVWVRPYEPDYFGADTDENSMIRKTSVFV